MSGWRRKFLGALTVCGSMLPVFCLAAEEPPAPDVIGTKLTIVQNLAAVTLRNLDISGQVSKIALKQTAVQTELQIEAEGNCAVEAQITNIHTRGAYLAAVLVGYGDAVDSYWAQPAYQGDDIAISSVREKARLLFDLSLFASTAVEVDAAAKLRKMGAKFTAGSTKELAFYRKNQRFELKIPLRMEMICQNYIHNRVTDKTERLEKWSRVITKDLTVPVRYDGDKRLKATFTKPLPLSANGGAQPKALPPYFRIRSVEIMSGPKNLRAVCPMTAGFKLRVHGDGAGVIRILVKSGNQTLQTSEVVQFQGPEQKIGFSLPLIKTKKSTPYAQQLGKVTVEVQGRREHVKGANLYPVRRKTAAYLWQYSCIHQ